MNDTPREHPDFVEPPASPSHPHGPQSRTGMSPGPGQRPGVGAPAGSFDGPAGHATPPARPAGSPPAYGPPPGTRLSGATPLPAGDRRPDWPVTPDRTASGFSSPTSRPSPPTQESLPGNPFRTAAPVRSAGPGYEPRAFEKRASRKGIMAAILAVALLSALLGGVAGVTATQYFTASEDAAVSAPTTGGETSDDEQDDTSTTVVQADPSNPDWEATAAAVSPAVVAIQVRSSQGAGAGSGVVIDTDGTIVTNNHVIAGGEATVVVGDKLYEAETVGTDPSTDLAVIRLVDPPSGMSTLEFADSTELRVGQPVMAVGNPLGLSDTVTTGIISALNRPVTTEEITEGDTGNGTVVTAAIQTSAAINPGNSGGALVDGSGRLVGITSSIAAMPGSRGGTAGNIGIGFAIPVNQVQNIVGQLLTDGSVTHAQLGVSARDAVGDGQLGAQVAEVVPGSAAAAGDLRVGDVITAVDGVTIANAEALVAMIRNATVDQRVTISYLRDGVEDSVEVTLGAAR